MKILFALLLVYGSDAFLITKAEPGVVVVAPGAQVTLFCAVDDHYEWCKFDHPGGGECDAGLEEESEYCKQTTSIV